MRQLVCLLFVLCSFSAIASPRSIRKEGICLPTQTVLAADSVFVATPTGIARYGLPELNLIAEYDLEGAVTFAFMPQALGDDVFLLDVYGPGDRSTWILGPDGVERAPAPVMDATQFTAAAVDSEGRFYWANTTVSGLAIQRLSEEGQWVTIAETEAPCAGARIHFDGDGTLQGRCEAFLFTLQNDELLLNQSVQLREHVQAVRTENGQIIWFGVDQRGDVVRVARDGTGAWQLETVVQSLEWEFLAASPDVILIGSSRYQRDETGLWSDRDSTLVPAVIRAAAGDWVLTHSSSLYRYDGDDYQLVESPAPEAEGCLGDWVHGHHGDGCSSSGHPRPGAFFCIFLFIVAGFRRRARNHTV